MADLVAECDPTVEPTKAQLKSRPWFCRSQQTVSDDAPKCLGDGHTINNTQVGLCRGRWQWYQLSTVQDHTVPYYVTERPPGGGPAQHVRKTRVETQRHASTPKSALPGRARARLLTACPVARETEAGRSGHSGLQLLPWVLEPTANAPMRQCANAPCANAPKRQCTMRQCTKASGHTIAIGASDLVPLSTDH